MIANKNNNAYPRMFLSVILKKLCHLSQTYMFCCKFTCFSNYAKKTQ